MNGLYILEGTLSATTIAEISVSCFLSALILAICIVVFREWIFWTLVGLELVAINLFYFFGLEMPANLSILCLMVTILVMLILSKSVVRSYVIDLMSLTKLSNKKRKSKKNIQDEKLYDDITTAVHWLADSKTGALMTFERNMSLDKYIRSGTAINCPVTPEILETIFYEGTRLHDGACVIRGDTIIAAACFFPSTNRLLVGKYGARHRAGLGISEVTDSVTVIVSEETGRISICYHGVIEAVKYDEFRKVFETFMTTHVNDTDFVDEEKGTSEDETGD